MIGVIGAVIVSFVKCNKRKYQVDKDLTSHKDPIVLIVIIHYMYWIYYLFFLIFLRGSVAIVKQTISIHTS